MNILIIGGGGREHALAWKLKQSPRVEQVYFAPGNGGTVSLGTNISIGGTDIPALIAFAKGHGIGLTVVGPEDPLIAGIVDEFEKAGLRIFGPTKAAARIEGSKAYAKDLMNHAKVPTANYETFDDYEEALAFVRTHGIPCFVKASGPALGKGAIPCSTLAGAEKALRDLMVDLKYGDAGKTVVIERFLSGKEVSAHAVCDRRYSLMFPFARDHKRALDGDRGENTGGMGTVAPVPVPSGFSETVQSEIVDRALEAMAMQRMPYKGLLFPGIIITEDHGPVVLEYNARFGDPETEVFMKLLDSDLLDLLEASIDDTLSRIQLKWKHGFAVCVILASGGYPGPYEKGKAITGIEDAEKVPGVTVFHAGTRIAGDSLITSGGRVLGVTCYAETLETAIQCAYQAVGHIHFEGMHYRTDIGRSLLR
ncbi:MAG: phosphoribosylamine--glycine ligase [Patescibacteria group bacterium]|nr:phosphoribosylamine--glycine ligase [Patescibacteria group bacterium]MDE2116580.1 phosphoribosylamine--glycine ligase [Patescibacteria group bacterium]